MKKTVIIGAVNSPFRYAYRAAEMLSNYGHPFIPIGIREGEMLGESILSMHDEPKIEGVDTITLYINPDRQKDWYGYLLGLHPKRIIFNPGTENQELKMMAEKQGIECLYACTLVMLSVGNY